MKEREVWGWDIWWDLDYEVELEQEFFELLVGRLGEY